MGIFYFRICNFRYIFIVLYVNIIIVNIIIVFFIFFHAASPILQIPVIVFYSLAK